jgi:MFS family permease
MTAPAAPPNETTNGWPRDDATVLLQTVEPSTSNWWATRSAGPPDPTATASWASADFAEPRPRPRGTVYVTIPIGGKPRHQRPSLASRLVLGSLVPRTTIGRHLAIIALIDSLGSGMFYAGSALYFTKVLGLTATQVGFGLSIAGAVGFFGAIPLGMLADRLQAGRVYVGLQIWRGLAYAAYCFTGDFTMFLVAACCIGLADTAVPPISQAVVGAAVSSEDRVDTLAKVRAVRNIGFGLGAIAATAVVADGSRWAFVALIALNAASFFVAAFLLRLAGVTKLKTTSAGKSRKVNVVADGRYGIAAVLNGALAIHLTLLPLGLPLWIAEHTKVPVIIFGGLYTLNTVLAVALQASFAKPAETVPGAARVCTWAGFALAGFGVVAYLMGIVDSPILGIALAIVATVLLTFGELWQSAGGWTISYELAKPDRRAQYLSTFQLGTSLQSIVAPFVVTKLILPNSGGWLFFAVCVTLAGLAMMVVVRQQGEPKIA